MMKRSKTGTWISNHTSSNNRMDVGAQKWKYKHFLWYRVATPYPSPIHPTFWWGRCKAKLSISYALDSEKGSLIQIYYNEIYKPLIHTCNAMWSVKELPTDQQRGGGDKPKNQLPTTEY